MLRFAMITSLFSAIVLSAVQGQGPDDKGAVLRGFDAPATPAPRTSSAPATTVAVRPAATPPRTPEYLKQLFPEAPAIDPLDAGPRRTFSFPEETPDINPDLQVTPAAGNWLIFIISYPGAKGPHQARKMVLELRSRKVPAYVYYYGADERRKEYDRVRKILAEQQDFFRKNGMTPELGLRVRYQNIEVQHAVLVGGYPDADAARRALEQVRRWTPPDPEKVDLETMFYKSNDGKNERAEGKYVNPFTRAFVCRNPSIKQETPKEDPKMDLQVLKRLNADESYSLLKCPASFTLAVKEFQTPFMMVDRNTPSSVWDTLAITKKARTDGAALSAHDLADCLRKIKLEAYVLHTKYSSVVTVGGFQSPEDPALKSLQELLATRFNQQPFLQVQFFHRPVPMPVPR